ncbi:pectinesterase [Sphingobacterium alkalisoli]|nr:pectinesterase [Sphingobacterium alkalisoli]
MIMIKIRSLSVFFLISYVSLAFASTDQIVVDQTGNGDFKTVQEAINAVRSFREEPIKIWIKEGTYKEKIVIPSHLRHIILEGESRTNTIITFDDYSGKVRSAPDECGLTKFGTFNSYSFLVLANDVTIKNMTIVNSSGPVGQAVALHVEADRVSVINCTILGNQDTLYLGKDRHRNYFYRCKIAGTTDFIFGSSTAFFEECEIESLRNSYITAASTTKESAYGFIFYKCRLTAVGVDVNKVYLGRPWRPHAKTVFIDCFMGEHIVPAGWDPWTGDKMFPDKVPTVYYAELGSVGPGGNDLSKRVTWSYQLPQSEQDHYAIPKVFGDWLPQK